MHRSFNYPGKHSGGNLCEYLMLMNPEKFKFPRRELEFGLEKDRIKPGKELTQSKINFQDLNTLPVPKDGLA